MSEDVVVFITGTGAVQGALSPVLEALGTLDDFRGISSADAANLALARVVYVTRFVHSESFDRASKGDEGRFERARTDALSGLRKVCGVIAEHLQRAEQIGRIEVRPQFHTVVERFVKPGTVSGFTTNWDTTVRRALGLHGLGVEYLHGQAQPGSTLYLPTEVADEAYREPKERRGLAGSLRKLIDAVERADRLVLYGVSLSALDVELAQGIAADPEGKKPRAITIVDPDHEAVRARLATLIRPDKLSVIEVCGLDPRELDV